MTGLVIFVDYDNVERNLTTAGPIGVARILTSAIPEAVAVRYHSVGVRLYGGWRSSGTLTIAAQKLSPQIHAGSPSILNRTFGQTVKQVKLSVELADRPMGWNVSLNETLAKDRALRNFRANPHLLSECVDVSACGMQPYFGLSPGTACNNGGCSSQLTDLLVRDEQKMVDTLIVADLAYNVFVEKARDAVVVSSDTDMWPGILLALGAGCAITHIHSRQGGKTQKHLVQTLGHRMSGAYRQLSL